MNTALLFSSLYGKTRKVVRAVLPKLSVQPAVFDAAHPPDPKFLVHFDALLFFCPTYGDEELPDPMEAFLLRCRHDLSRQRFAICELGSYYGYEDFSFGAMRILRRRLFELNATELCLPLSLDSFPRLHWPQLFRWIDCLNSSLNAWSLSAAAGPVKLESSVVSEPPRCMQPLDSRNDSHPPVATAEIQAGTHLHLRGASDSIGVSKSPCSDAKVLQQLERAVGAPIHYRMENDRCVALDLTSSHALFHSLIRHHSPAEKAAILKLICRLDGLRELNLRRSKIGVLPPEFKNLQYLERLNLGSNALGSIPAELKALHRLKFLHLGNNAITEIPGFVSQWQQLEYLALHKNMRIKCVDPIAPLKQLQHLNLFYINLHRLPGWIYALRQLRTLTVWNITEFNDDLAELKQLECFTHCGACGLRALPSAFTRLTNLRMARLFQNGLETLPEEIGNLRNLEQLSLYQQNLSHLPDSTRALTQLKKLNLGWNRFRQLPDWLSELPSLQWLAVFQNPLEQEPRVGPHTSVLREWPFTTVEPSTA